MRMISPCRRKAPLLLLVSLFLPGVLIAQDFDGVWTGPAIPDSSAPGDCEGGEGVVLVDHTEVRGGFFGWDPFEQEYEEQSIQGTVSEGGQVTDGIVQNELGTVTTLFTALFSGTVMNVDWEDTADESCFGTAQITQRASYLEGFDEKWVGTAAETQNLPDCPGADPIGDVILTISGATVVGSIEITQAGEVPVTFLITGTLGASRELMNGAVQVGSTDVATVTGTFGAAEATLNYDDSECTGTVTLALSTPANTPPTASPLAFGVVAGATFNGLLPAEDADEGDTLTYSIVAQPTQGVVDITNASTGAFSYTANASASGPDSFQFRANDGTDDSNDATVSVTIEPAPREVPIEALIMIIGGSGDDESEE